MDEMDEQPAAEEGNDQAWMATFADLSTLLLTFFVLLLSFANMDVVQFREMLGSMKEAFGYQTVNFGNFNPPVLSVKKDSSETTEKDRQSQAENAAAAAAEKKGKGEQDADKRGTGENEKAEETVPSELSPSDRQLVAELEKMVAQERMQDSIQLAVSSRGVVIRVRENVMFKRGTDRIVDQAFNFLNEIAALLRRFDYDVIVEGHTDNRPSRSRKFPTNWELSAGRAISVMRYLAEVGGVDPRRMGAAGYADMRPVASNDTPEGRLANRRVEFLCHRHPSLSRPQILTSGVAPAPGN